MQYQLCFPESEVASVEFHLLNNDDTAKSSSCVLTTKDMFSGDRPVDNGIYSLSMGTTSNTFKCKTCLNTRDKCLGHFGSIQLRYPVINPLARSEVLRWLKQVCYKCGEALGKMNDEGVLKTSSSKNIISCAYCKFEQPTFMKDPKEPLFFLKKLSSGEEIRLFNDEIESILSRISSSTVKKINPTIIYHPKDLMIRVAPVIPNNARPDVRKLKGGGRSNNNDTTTFIKNIVSVNETIPLLITDETRLEHENSLNLLDITYSNMIREPSGNAMSSKIVGGNGQTLTSLGSRLRGKEGRIRGNLESNRFQNGARSVISGDNFIKIDEVGIPIQIAKVLQVPEIVQPYNISKLMKFFLNKTKTYPGCTKLVKGDTGATYQVASIKDNIKLEYGDTLYRDLVDGDVVAMNRAPSLLYSAISGHRVRIISNGDTFKLSVNVADTLYGGDFDGDAMNVYHAQSLIARNECGTLSHLLRWFISYKDRAPAMGVYHDNLIGMFELTKNAAKFDRYHAMQLLSQVDYPAYLHGQKRLKTSGDLIGRDVISLLLPDINYNKKATFFKPEYSGFIKYDPLETHVNIERGVLKSGVLDKKSVGQGVSDSLFHVVFNKYGVHTAIDLLYNMQQVATQYMLTRGMTVNYNDIAIDKKMLTSINDVTSSILHQSQMLTKKYRAGLITPPIGMTAEAFYEQEQMAILSPGDDFTEVVMSNLDHENNNLVKLVFSGTKGKPTNILQMSSSIGQMSIKGERMKKKFDFERALPYARRFHDEPEAVGFIPESFVTGVSSLSAIAQQQDGRNGITTKALSTGITGYHNRKCNKALETVIVDNRRRTIKCNFILQQVYGNDGVDIRKAAYVDFNPLMVSDIEFEKIYKIEMSELPKNMRNSTNEEILKKMLTHMQESRTMYRTKYQKIESMNFKDVLMSSQQVLPVNPVKIHDDIVYDHAAYIKTIDSPLSPSEWLEMIKQLKRRLQYTHFNEYYESVNGPISECIEKSFVLMFIAIDIGLSYKRILMKNTDRKIMKLVSDSIVYTYKKSLIEYGTSIGMIASQCTSESMTQRILDSIHASGASKSNFLTRIKEVYGAKGTEQLSNPYMDVFIKDELASDITTMQQIANQIEMMNLKRFVTRAQIFHEEYKNTVHPDYVDESKDMVRSFEKHFINSKPPSGLLPWCLRLEFSHAALIEKSMQVSMIYRKLMEQYPLLYILYTDDNSKNITMRVYFHRDLFSKSGVVDQNVIYTFMKTKLLKTLIRGIDGITSAMVLKEYVPRTIVQEDGSMKVIRKHIIRTSGTNLSELMKHQSVDVSKTSSNSILEIQELYGIDAARNKLIQCLREMSGSDINIKHYMLIADTLTYNGYISNIERSGIQESNPNNALLCMSYSHPIQAVTEAGINNETSFVSTNISSSLMMGTVPEIGSNYNTIVMNEEFIKSNTETVSDLLNDI